MGKGKHNRKVIAGLLKTIGRHQGKIEQELHKAVPDPGLIRKWEKDIDIARRRMRKFEERLEK
jgi:hypothetical protein